MWARNLKSNRNIDFEQQVSKFQKIAVVSADRAHLRRLGSELGEYAQRHRGALPSPGTLQGAVADLAANLPDLQAPLRDLVSRQTFAALIPYARSGAGSIQRDALIQEISRVYHPSVLVAVEEILNGFLDASGGIALSLSQTELTNELQSFRDPSEGTSSRQYYSESPVKASSISVSQPKPAQTSISSNTTNQANNGLVSSLIALVGVLTGVLVITLTWLIMSRGPRQQISTPASLQAEQANPPKSTPKQPPQPEPEINTPEEIPTSGISQSEARSLIDRWLTVKQQIFAPPFDTNLADQLVAAGPLWTDLTKPGGSIQWLQNNNSYYTYSTAKVNDVISFTPSESMPSIVVSVTEDSVLHSPKGSTPSSNTNNWVYTFKQEGGSWKLWDYRKQ